MGVGTHLMSALKSHSPTVALRSLCRGRRPVEVVIGGIGAPRFLAIGGGVAIGRFRWQTAVGEEPLDCRDAGQNSLAPVTRCRQQQPWDRARLRRILLGNQL